MVTPVDGVIGRLVDPPGRGSRSLNSSRLRVYKLEDLRHGQAEAITAGSAVAQAAGPLEPPGERSRPPRVAA
jgi:hypothetical protein